MKELNVRGKSVWKLYLTLHGWFALLYGAFASYCYLYLGIQVRLAGGLEYLPRSLLPFMAGTLLVEALSAPFAGVYADSCGRRAAVKRGLHLLAASYAALASLPLIRACISDTDSAAFWTLWIGLAGIALMSVAAAFHANALDAWFVDELVDSPARASLLKTGAAKPDLHRYFARQSQVFGASLLGGGLIMLVAGKWLADSSRKETAALLSPGSSIWVIGALGALWLARRLASRVAAASPAPKLRVKQRLAEVVRSRELMRALLLSSAVYFCGLALIYFLPELLRARGGEGAVANPSAAWLVEHYWVFYVGIGLTRVFGPALALRSGPRKPSFDNTPMARLNAVNLRGFAFRKRQAWYWGALGFGGVAAAGVAFLAVPDRWFLVPLALILLAKLAIEAFKPVQASYLNELASRSSRAFALSLATPVGSAALGGLALLIIGLEGASPGSLPLEQARLAIPLAFSVLGLLTLVVLRAVTRPARSAALGENWDRKRRRLRDELRKEGELLPEDGPENGEDFVRPLGAGDSPEMRPGNGLASGEIVRTGHRAPKPQYLRYPEDHPAAATPPARPPQAPPAPARKAPGSARPNTGRPNLRIVYSRPEAGDRTENAGET